jgi:hypothetical protein
VGSFSLSRRLAGSRSETKRDRRFRGAQQPVKSLISTLEPGRGRPRSVETTSRSEGSSNQRSEAPRDPRPPTGPARDPRSPPRGRWGPPAAPAGRRSAPRTRAARRLPPPAGCGWAARISSRRCPHASPPEIARGLTRSRFMLGCRRGQRASRPRVFPVGGIAPSRPHRGARRSSRERLVPPRPPRRGSTHDPRGSRAPRPSTGERLDDDLSRCPPPAGKASPEYVLAVPRRDDLVTLA